MDKGNMNGRGVIFGDTSAFKAVFDSDDDFHGKAIAFWEDIKEERKIILTSNFILDELFTLVRSHLGKAAVLRLRQDLLESPEQLKVIRITIKDELSAWKYFENLPGRKLSFTDCTSFALMKRLGLKEVFAFDDHFGKAGFSLRP